MNLSSLPLSRHAAGLAALLLAAGALAQTPAAAPPAAAAASAPRPAAAPPAPARPPGALTPFAEITREAKRAEGFLSLWTKDEKTWIEIPAELLDKPFFFGNSLASGLGERFVFPGLMGREHIAVLRRVGNNIQLVARNNHARAPEGTPLARAVGESYSESLLGAAPLAAAPHADSKALLVEAFALLGGDITGLQTHLENGYRLSYSLDRGNSSIERAAAGKEGLTLTVRGHYTIPKLPAQPVTAPGAPPPNPAALPSPSQVVPDARSLFISVAYTLAPLPAQPMKPRAADQRVGYFTTPFVDFGNDTSEGRRTHFIERWRLEKKDPAAEISEPLVPIRVVMDRNIPEKWREPVRLGVLEWNKAFERAGIRNAIALEQQAADASWASVEGARMLAVRWFATEGPGAVAVGPSQSDPRTGEILRGAAIIPENWVRVFRQRTADTEPRPPAFEVMPGEFAKRFAVCNFADAALAEAQFGFELMVARGAFDPTGPEAERYIANSLKDVTMHEVGHALGLRHNFRASSTITPAQLRDARFTAERGTSNSVMDYNALNVPLESEPASEHHMVTLGAYDYWAIEYGYREFAPEQEAAELQRLASMSERDANLAYGTDEDVDAFDPLVNRSDLGNDPLAFVQRQLELVRELWRHTQKKPLAAEDDMTLNRRNLTRGLGMLGQTLPIAAKYVGGTFTSRAKAGAGQPLLAPVPAAQQRAALDLLTRQLFDPASFRFEPRFMSRLGVDHLERLFSNRPGGVDFSLAGAVAAMQRGALDALTADALAQRLADAETKVAEPSALLSYADVQERLRRAVWAELAQKSKANSHIDSLRRTLQREHLKRLAGGVLRPTSTATADVRAVHRQIALALQTQLKAALAGRRWTATSRAHLDDSLATLSEALKAPLAKQGV